MPRKRSKQALLLLTACSFLACIICIVSTGTRPPFAAAASAPEGQIVETIDENSSLDNLIRIWLRIPALEHSNVGFEIMELPSGRVLYSFNGNRRFTPASTVKAITTACAFDTLGGAYTYKTSVIAEGQINGSTLTGNLVIVPSQDPTFSRIHLSNLIKESVQATARIPGASTLSDITGQVKLAPTQWSDLGFHQSWLVEDWGRHWMPVSSNLVLDRNLASPAELPDSYRVMDASNTHGSLFNSLLNSPDGPTWLYMDRANRVALTYRPKHPQAPQTPSYSMANPDEYNLAMAENMVKHHSIKIQGQDVPLSGADQVYQLAQHESNPLSAIIKTCLAESDNLFAQQILRTIGLSSLPPAKPAAPPDKAGTHNLMSLEARGLNSLSRWLSKIGVNGQEVILFDGCGLCRKNSVSPHALNMVLKHMAGETVSGPFISLMRADDESNYGKGRYRFKTGTMDSVRCITGVLTTAGGQHLAVTIMVDGHTPSIRNLRIAESALINQLRVIKHIGQSVPKVMPGAPTDPNVTVSAHEKVIIDYAAQKRVPKPAPRHRAKSRSRRH
ncbi:MAG: D-alanyl-D-alanine carboxypeptidase/D-alanyl-D-alanine-endopeptidase [Candidatus Obscuribacterales bacterium]|nr:D-alanyl-D-alanine carboxypeptidase/D-alanyl-D-alanine-endopeptidase [Candidatus Obscuribacterales bacterium]